MTIRQTSRHPPCLTDAVDLEASNYQNIAGCGNDGWRAKRATEDRLEDTRVAKTLWPGQPGAIQWQRKYGTRLVCVRYRQDASGLRRYTTVEMVVKSSDTKGKAANERIYAVEVDYRDEHLRALVKMHGARWHAPSKRWHLKGASVIALKLQSAARPLPRK